MDENFKITEHEVYKNFKLFVRTCYVRCMNDDDAIIVLNGNRGSGKSTFGVRFLIEYCSLLGQSFNKKWLRKHIISDADLLEKSIKSLPEYEPILVDEAVISMFVGDFATRQVKDLIKLFTVSRTKHRPVVIVSPSMTDVTTRLRNFAIYRVKVIKRTVGVLFCRDDSDNSMSDPFHLEDFKKIEGYWDSSTPLEVVVKRLRKHPCYKDSLLFSRLPKEVQEWYDEYRDEMVFGEKQDEKDVMRDIEKFAMIHLSINSRWGSLRLKDRITANDFSSLVCVNYLTGQCLFKNASEFRREVSRISKMKEAEKQVIVIPEGVPVVNGV